MSIRSAAVAPRPIVTASEFGFERIQIETVVLHRLQSKNPETGTLTPPEFSAAAESLSQHALDALQLRLTEALKKKSHAVEMSIELADADSFFQLAATSINGNAQSFVTASQKMAERLGLAQLSTSAPPGMLCVLRGRVGGGSKRFIAVVKADIVDGFAAGVKDISYIERVFLTPSQRLYKIGVLVEVTAQQPDGVGQYDCENYRAFLFDHLLTSIETRSAAVYFYHGLLGFGLQHSAKKLTRDFFEKTSNFIDTRPLSWEEKREFKEALRTELRSQNSQIHVLTFARSHLPEPLQEPYRDFMAAEGFPRAAVMKDTDYVKARLRRPRRILFDSEVKIEIPANSAADLVRIDSEREGTTTVVIQGRVTGQE